MISIFWHHTYLMLFFAPCFIELAFAQGNFSLFTSGYDCSDNLICLGDAHTYSDNLNGTLSLTRALTGEGNGDSGGIAYYNRPVRFMDPANGQAASFRTNFSCYQVVESEDTYDRGDGFTFVISANNSTLGERGDGFFGFFSSTGNTEFKSIAVEFDSVRQRGSPVFDKSSNHVSFDFMKIRTETTRDANEVHLNFSQQGFLYVWVEYNAQKRNLEVRIRNLTNRPANPFLNQTVDLTQYLEEYMWVGFSAGHGAGWSYYYIGDWYFESYGIPAVSPSSPRSRKISTRVVVGAVVSGVVGFVGLVLLICFLLVQRRGSPGNGGGMLQAMGVGEGYRFSYKELKAATRGFDENRKLGQGGFGSVYQGVLPRSNLAIAVKTLKQESKQGEKEFKAEVSVMSHLRHRNLIQLLGWCIKGGEYHIVYELMPNGSLDKYLFRPLAGNHEVLSWPLRWSIMEGTAAAVDYLHRGWTQQVIHRDIKTSNILLDHKWNAKLGDFGLARVADHQQMISTTVVAGTYGYISPEAVSGRFTDKSDVYAFGIVALEMACGRKSIAFDVEPEENILVDWVWRCLMAGDLFRVVDPRLNEYDKGQIEALLLMGLFCSHPDPLARPSMRTVVQVLLGDTPVPPAPTKYPDPV